VTEIVEGNDTDKQEAIDELREEYEEQVQQAVQETRQLMEGELKKLRLELEVYEKTLIQVKAGAAEGETTRAGLADTVTKLQGQLQEQQTRLAAAEAARSSVEQQHQQLQSKDTELAELRAKLAQQETVLQQQLDSHTEQQVQQKVEQAVSAARLEWLKRLPEAEQAGGAARASLGELERVRAREASSRAEYEARLGEVGQQLRASQEEVDRLNRKVGDAHIQGTREAEERLGRELKASLTAQRQQWEEVVTSTREEAEQARQQLEQHWEQQLALLEQRLKQAEEDKVELTRRERIDSGQRARQSGREAELELELQRGKAELQRYRDQALHSGQELERQKGEVGVMMGRWRQEMETIQASHGQVQQELEEARTKYSQLKSKVRKYQRHVEAKEEHYRSEYVRLEREFRATLEKLRTRMEAAYSVKEREVEVELGSMRQQLSQQLRQVAGSSSTGPANIEQPVRLPRQ